MVVSFFDMTSFRDRVNAHLPIVLQVVSTASLFVIALSAICGSQSLKSLSESLEMRRPGQIHNGHLIKRHELKMHKVN